MKLLIIIINIVSILVISRVIYNFIKERIRHKKVMRKIEIWGDFHKQLLSWADEITDSNTKVQFIDECVGKITSDHDARDKEIYSFDVELEKLKILKKWGNHIPSLKQEWREKQLRKIL